MDLDAVADQLYEMKPAEFTQARDACAAEARKEGDRQTADELKRLRRPSVGAWMANLLLRARRDEVDHLIALGGSLRDAQDTLDGDAIRRLTSEGRVAVTALVDAATRLVREEGENVSPAASEELEATLDAALIDPDAAATLRQGRLTSGLRYSGLGLRGIEDRRDPDTVRAKRSSARSGRPASRTAELTAAERALDAAGRDLARAKARLVDAEAVVAAAQTRLTELKEKVAERRSGVREAEKAMRTAEKRVGALEARRT